jgi:hypothetical protein
MSDTDTTAPAPEEKPKPALPQAVQLQNAVKEGVKGLDTGDTSARSRVVDSLVEQELVRRTGVLSAALTKRKDLQSALNKIKPDQVTVDPETGDERGVFTKAKFQERKKALETLAKLDKQINAVITDPSPQTYQKLAGK